MNRWMDTLKPISRAVIEQAVEETRTADKKQKDYEQSRQAWRALNPQIEIRSFNHA